MHQAPAEQPSPPMRTGRWAKRFPQHIQLSGGLKLDWTDKPDLVLAVNTPEKRRDTRSERTGRTAGSSLTQPAISSGRCSSSWRRGDGWLSET